MKLYDLQVKMIEAKLAGDANITDADITAISTSIIDKTGIAANLPPGRESRLDPPRDLPTRGPQSPRVQKGPPGRVSLPDVRGLARCGEVSRKSAIKKGPPLDEPLRIKMVGLIGGFWFGFLGKEFL